jgi:hydroxypyruvate isomerase
VEVILINMPGGSWERGDRGLGCLPARLDEFRSGVRLARDYARVLQCGRINCLAGIAPPGGDPQVLRKTFVHNVRYAASELAGESIEVLIEPMNTRSFPGAFLQRSAQAFALMDEVGAPNVRLQYDLFHMQVMEGDLTRTLETNLSRIGHIQFADVPDRHEPGTGEINFDHVFALLDRLGYSGWVGAEYVPREGTAASLGWMRPYLERKNG